MIVNLLARLQGVVERVGIVVPDGIPLLGRTVPFGTPEGDLRTAVLQGAAEIDVVPVSIGSVGGWHMTVGPGSGISGSLRVHGNGWIGGISPSDLFGQSDSDLPFGPYIAACLAVAEVFKAIRMKPESRTKIVPAYYSSWEHRVCPILSDSGPLSLSDLHLDCTLAGVGAVGSAWLHTIWSLDEVSGNVVLADNDITGIDVTNLNRYVFVGKNSVGLLKASAAAHAAYASPLVWHPHDKGVEALTVRPRLVISAVDLNTSRRAIQLLYPDRILSASTSDLRSEVMRCGPPGVGACLACFNPPETMAPDGDIQERLRTAPRLQKLVVDELGLNAEEVATWAHAGNCGMTGERVLGYFRAIDSAPTRFAVGFVSAMAGILLAAETIKESMSATVPLRNDLSRAVFQFVVPASPVNGAKRYLRDTDCTLCSPHNLAHGIWTKRFVSFGARD